MKVDKLYDVPINFKVWDKTEDDALWKIQHFLKAAIIHFDMQNEVVEHELFEFVNNGEAN